MLISLSIDHHSTDSDDTHTVDAYTAPVSSPPTSSPVTVTPPDCLDEEVDRSDYLESHGLERIHEDHSSVHPPMSQFVYRLNSLLVAAQRDRAASLQRSRLVSAQPFHAHAHGLPADTDCGGPPSSKRRHSRVDSDGPGSAPDSGAALKKRKLSRRHWSASGSHNSAAHASVPRLSGAFRLSEYAKGPGSLRRAESLRSELSAVEEEQVLNEVFEGASSSQGQEARSQRSSVLVPQRLPIILGSIASPFGAYVATVPTTPTANDVQERLSSTSVPQDLGAVPVEALPSFELLLKPPLNKEHAAECRIVALLLRERNERDEDGLSSITVALVAEDGENQSEASSASPTLEGGDDEHSMTVEELQRLNPPSPQLPQESRRATISLSPLELDIDENLFDLTIRWLLEVYRSLALCLKLFSLTAYVHIGHAVR
ncbi:hypothetical protein C8Q74DRAFT_945559 [Fomes fomentarius]|nr:hypothetical protein C8Q74DRAFT_945559 [Fomes fomentarius]